jgi:hypothetical protein
MHYFRLSPFQSGGFLPKGGLPRRVAANKKRCRSMAHIIVVGNEKGGSGKSTTSMHATTALARMLRLIDLSASLLAPPEAAADIFSDIETGTWGYAPASVPGHEMTCAENPHHISVNADRTFLTVHFKKRTSDPYGGLSPKEVTYFVVTQKPRRLVLERSKDDSAFQGQRFEMFVLRDGRRYRWKSSDEPDSHFFG